MDIFNQSERGISVNAVVFCRNCWVNLTIENSIACSMHLVTHCVILNGCVAEATWSCSISTRAFGANVCGITQQINKIKRLSEWNDSRILSPNLLKVHQSKFHVMNTNCMSVVPQEIICHSELSDREYLAPQAKINKTIPDIPLLLPLVNYRRPSRFMQTSR